MARPTIPGRDTNRLIAPLELPGLARFAITREVLSMPGKTAKVTITERQQDILRTIQNAPTVSSQLRQRAAIILLAFDPPGQSPDRRPSRTVAAAGQPLAATLGRRLGPAHSHRVPRKPRRLAPGHRASPPR